VNHAGTADTRAPITIVPLSLLPFALSGVVVVASVATNILWLLLICHVVGGASWTAIDPFVGLVVHKKFHRLCEYVAICKVISFDINTEVTYGECSNSRRSR
jgi:hypothetical protein